MNTAAGGLGTGAYGMGAGTLNTRPVNQPPVQAMQPTVTNVHHQTPLKPKVAHSPPKKGGVPPGGYPALGTGTGLNGYGGYGMTGVGGSTYPYGGHVLSKTHQNATQLASAQVYGTQTYPGGSYPGGRYPSSTGAYPTSGYGTQPYGSQ